MAGAAEAAEGAGVGVLQGEGSAVSAMDGGEQLPSLELGSGRREVGERGREGSQKQEGEGVRGEVGGLGGRGVAELLESKDRGEEGRVNRRRKYEQGFPQRAKGIRGSSPRLLSVGGGW